MLRRILIGNILSMSKVLGYVLTEEIKVSGLDVYPVKEPVWLKGVRMAYPPPALSTGDLPGGPLNSHVQAWTPAQEESKRTGW